MKPLKGKKQNIFVLSLFVLLVGIFFYPTILKGKLPVPADTLVGMYHPWRDLYSGAYPRGIPFKNFLITDPVRQQIPWRKVVIDYWKTGKLPGWNPYSFSGTPLSANIQAAPFYPFNILFLIFNFPLAWTILIILQPLLSGIFLYFYLRRLKLLPQAALLGAVIWSFSGFSVAWLTWGTMVQTVMWLPLILLAIEEFYSHGRRRQFWSAILIIGLIMQFLAGHIQISLYLTLLVIAYFLWKQKQVKFSTKKTNIYFLVSLIIVIIITSIQWIPLLELLPQSSRLSEISNWKQAGWFLPWQNLVQFVVPDFFGNPATGNYWGIWNYGEFIGYIGIGSLIFVLTCLLHVKEKTVRFWWAMLAVCLIFVLPNPLSRLIYQLHIPILGVLQPTRLMSIIDFALAILAACGFNYWLSHKLRISTKPLLLIVLILAGLWIFVLMRHYLPIGSELQINLAISQRNLILPTIIFLMTSVLALTPGTLIPGRWPKVRITTCLIILVIIFDLFRFGWKFTPFTPQEYFFPITRTIKFLQAQTKPFRVMSLDPRIMPANAGAYYGIEMVEGYDPLVLSGYEKFFAALARGKPDIAPPYGFNRIISSEFIDSPLIPLLNVRYILALYEIKKPFLKEVMREGDTRVYEDMRFQPRFYFVELVNNAESERDEINQLFTVDIGHAAVTSTPLELINVPIGEPDTIDLQKYSNSEIILTYRSTSDRLLVISNIYEQGWRAEIDGKRVGIHRINYILQGVVALRGKHSLKLFYE
ncbi:YfhO family protein [Patescibacteria group bacterium]|nr:YfhO family protein [Patescibacteria group bacterium]MBU1472752.1 YfhO family protein [Patescibacteria group bacterium]MBU2460018.1 YfhO family protein [Patescibacteria group bacterium]MBU2544324.1 YfhO family protein [Patescibacteria group bacterium]